jgi:Family of unknown function (DUF6114)
VDTSADGEDPTGAHPVGPGPRDMAGPGPGRPAPGWWSRFRAWRRSRPFWGGLLLLLAGVELLAIPLLSVLAHGSVKVVIYIGIGGVFGVLIGGLLVACGLLIWYHPVQRVFYAIAGVLLAVASFVATNLGGFFIGMLLGVTGASLSFGWAPGPGQPAGQHRPRRARPRSPAGSLTGLLRDRGRGPEPAPSAPQPDRPAPQPDRPENAGGRDGQPACGTQRPERVAARPGWQDGPPAYEPEHAAGWLSGPPQYPGDNPPGGVREAGSDAGRRM